MKNHYQTVYNDFVKQLSRDIKGHQHLKYTLAISVRGARQYSLIGDEGLELYKNYHYEIGSITKIFTGLLIAKAVQEKKLSINDSIATHIPELRDRGFMPTIEKILTHRSGMEYDPDHVDGDDFLPEENPFLHLDKQSVIEDILSQDLKDTDYPYVYSNLGAAALGLVLEHVYQQSCISLLEEFTSGIGLTDTCVLNPPYDLEGLRPDGQLDGHWVWKENSAFAPAGCLVSTAKDMLTFGEFLLQSEKSYVKLAHQILDVTNMADIHRGIGFFLFNFPDYNMFFHDGGTGCFHSTLCIQYDRQVVAIALSNAYHHRIEETFKLTRRLADTTS